MRTLSMTEGTPTLCSHFRRLSCEACIRVTDSGLDSLSTCPNLTDLTVSYCKVYRVVERGYNALFVHSQLTDSGLHSVAVLGVLRRLVVRGCSQLTSKGASTSQSVYNYSLFHTLWC